MDNGSLEQASTDSEIEDFAAGSAGTGLTVATTSSGAELILTPAMMAEFGTEAMPDDWFVEAWKDGGAAHVKSGTLQLDGVRAGYVPLFGSIRSLEFVATFTKRRTSTSDSGPTSKTSHGCRSAPSSGTACMPVATSSFPRTRD